eukprot:1635315-Pyramimonas_sp.AAC.3
MRTAPVALRTRRKGWQASWHDLRHGEAVGNARACAVSSCGHRLESGVLVSLASRFLALR